MYLIYKIENHIYLYTISKTVGLKTMDSESSVNSTVHEEIPSNESIMSTMLDAKSLIELCIQSQSTIIAANKRAADAEIRAIISETKYLAAEKRAKEAETRAQNAEKLLKKDVIHVMLEQTRSKLAETTDELNAIRADLRITRSSLASCRDEFAAERTARKNITLEKQQCELHVKKLVRDLGEVNSELVSERRKVSELKSKMNQVEQMTQPKRARVSHPHDGSQMGVPMMIPIYMMVPQPVPPPAVPPQTVSIEEPSQEDDAISALISLNK
jgi:chromosome segregation ATPase